MQNMSRGIQSLKHTNATMEHTSEELCKTKPTTF